ncbi:MAG: hypothetical protein L0191_08870, partial [Acidobacteria bacterium]|nr:hypothetical protein [Acidobacteriota bacterium]
MPTERVRSPEQLSPFAMTTEQIEQALLEDRSGQLRPYFGDALYEELRDLTRRTVQRGMRRAAGPRLLILPGIMGSQLGTPRRLLFNDVIWFNPITLAQGR